MTQEVKGSTHVAGFSVTMLPGSWVKGKDNYGYYVSVQLIFTIRAYYKRCYQFPCWYLLSLADFELIGRDKIVEFTIDTERCGLETGDKNTEFMGNLLWWATALIASKVNPVVGVTAGLVPILAKYFSPSTSEIIGSHVWANGTFIDPDSDNWGTISFVVEVRFYGSQGEGLKDYTFSVKMVSWIAQEIPGEYLNAMYKALPYTMELTFTVNWGP